MNKLLIALVLATPLAMAADTAWKPLGQVRGGDFAVNLASVVKADKGVKAWTRMRFAEARTSPGGKSYKLVLALHQYACEERTTNLLVQQFYANDVSDGTPVENIKYEKFNAEDVAPDTPTERALKLVCAEKK